MKILRSLARGALHGLVATCTMSAAMALAKVAGVLGEPPPRKLTRRVLGRFGVRLRDRVWLDTLALAAHFGFGAAAGAGYGALPRRFAANLGGGALYGLAVWAGSYAGWVPRLGLMARPKSDRPLRPTAMIAAHLVFGGTMALLRKRTFEVPDAARQRLLTSVAS